MSHKIKRGGWGTAGREAFVGGEGCQIRSIAPNSFVLLCARYRPIVWQYFSKKFLSKGLIGISAGDQMCEVVVLSKNWLDSCRNKSVVMRFAASNTDQALPSSYFGETLIFGAALPTVRQRGCQGKLCFAAGLACFEKYRWTPLNPYPSVVPKCMGYEGVWAMGNYYIRKLNKKFVQLNYLALFWTKEVYDRRRNLAVNVSIRLDMAQSAYASQPRSLRCSGLAAIMSCSVASQI